MTFDLDSCSTQIWVTRTRNSRPFLLRIQSYERFSLFMPKGGQNVVYVCLYEYSFVCLCEYNFVCLCGYSFVCLYEYTFVSLYEYSFVYLYASAFLIFALWVHSTLFFPVLFHHNVMRDMTRKLVIYLWLFSFALIWSLQVTGRYISTINQSISESFSLS